MVTGAAEMHELRKLLAPHIRHTPVVSAPRGGALKLESLQPTGSFKVRGFFAAGLALSPAERRRGLLTVSAGNAALACAHVARTLGVPCRVVMYDDAPRLKADGVRALGAEIVPKTHRELHEWVHARAWEDEPEVFIHPFANDTVMAGHGTLAAELIDDVPDVERVIVPVGGGGLVCGVGEAFRALGHAVTVVGVQSEGYPLWLRAFDAGGPVALTPDTIADGTTAPYDASMLERLRAVVDEWILIPEAEVRLAVARVVSEVKVVAEGSAALAYAALAATAATRGTVAILSGGNIDSARLAGLLTA